MFSGFELYSMADLNSETPLYPGSLYSVRFSRDVNKRVLWMMCFRNDETIGMERNALTTYAGRTKCSRIELINR